MAVIAFVPDAEDAAFIVEWAVALMEPNESIEFLCLCSEESLKTDVVVSQRVKQIGLSDAKIQAVQSTAPVAVVLDACRSAKSRLLVTSGFQLPKSGAKEQTALELIRSAPCMTVAPMFGNKTPKNISRALSIVGSDQHGVSTLRLTEMLRKRIGFDTTAATVEDDSGPKAARAGKKAVQTLLNDAGLDEDDFEIDVAVDRLPQRGILSVVDNHDVIVCGANSAKYVMPLEQAVGDTTVVVVKRNPPLRLQSIGDWLPRINPRDHAELLQDLRAGSQWNGDFISMLGLASAIASLGLMQNSPAVVIGSMLLAPLMTPMIGAGLALAQSNIRLSFRCGATISMGIFLTLAVSFLLGLVTPSRETLSPEVLSRGQPNVLDLLIALFSAVAATISMSRPNIAGAVAGVAIATALVPPLCAVGLSVSHGSFDNAFGALTLFSTNLIAIIIASAFTFRLLGIVPGRTIARHRTIAMGMKIGLAVILLLLIGPLSQQFMTQLKKGREQTSMYPVTRAVARALRDHVNKNEDVEIVSMGRSSVMEGVVIYIAGRNAVPESYADELRAIVQEVMQDPNLPVYIVCLSGQWLNMNKPLPD